MMPNLSVRFVGGRGNCEQKKENTKFFPLLVSAITADNFHPADYFLASTGVKNRTIDATTN